MGRLREFAERLRSSGGILPAQDAVRLADLLDELEVDEQAHSEIDLPDSDFPGFPEEAPAESLSDGFPFVPLDEEFPELDESDSSEDPIAEE